MAVPRLLGHFIPLVLYCIVSIVVFFNISFLNFFPVEGRERQGAHCFRGFFSNARCVVHWLPKPSFFLEETRALLLRPVQTLLVTVIGRGKTLSQVSQCFPHLRSDLTSLMLK